MPPKYTMSDSESEAGGEVPDTPSDQVLEKSLRDQVAAIFKSGNMEELTVKRVRLAAEDTLGLTAGYFKSTGDWKARSEDIIKNEVVSLSLHLHHSFTSFRGKDTDYNAFTGNTRSSNTKSTIPSSRGVRLSSPEAKAHCPCEASQIRDGAKA